MNKLKTNVFKTELNKITISINQEKKRRRISKSISEAGRWNSKSPSPGSKRTYSLKKHQQTGGKSKTGCEVGHRR